MSKINDATSEELVSLSAIHREAYLAFVKGSYLKVAAELGIPIGTVKSRINRARKHIAKMREQ
jgi:DNA-directed RNA polymerase specialized sigma24 family protein